MTQLENTLILLYHRLSTNDVAPIVLLVLLLVIIVQKLELTQGMIRPRRREGKEGK